MWYIAKWCVCCDFGQGNTLQSFQYTIFTVKVLFIIPLTKRIRFLQAFINGLYGEWIAEKRKFFSHKIRLFETFNRRPCWTLKKWQIFLHFHTPQSLKSQTFVNLKPENGIPIRGDPSKIVHYSKYPRRLGFDYLDLVTVSYHGYQMCQIWWVEKRRCGTSRISIKAGINNDRRLEWCETHEK